MALDLPGRSASADGTALAALSAAAQAGRRVRLHYRSAQSAPTERDFDPYGLAYRGGRWYVVGHCHLRKGLRSFRIDRILGVHATEADFERPADFDALGHLVFAVATIPRAFAVEVRLKTDLATARRELFATIGVLEAAREDVVLRGQTDDLDWFARELARLPFDFEIRHPAALRDALRLRARALLARASVSGSALSRRR
jgi:predicted DNA-binding transcriptional regulator YafY